MQELPHEIEGFLEHGLDAPIYSENIRFTEPRHSGIQLNGRTAYQGMARALRLAMNAYFSQPTITILSMRQVPVSEQRSEGDSDMAMAEAKHYEVMVRWVFEGVPRHMELIGRGDEGSRYEGEFRYALDPETALVAVHEVTAIHPAPPTAIFGSASPLARWAGWLSPRGSLSLARNTDTAGNKRSRMRRHQPWWFE
ncbi:hypothetical protein GGI07_002617 [Coemansia sp. Benny D115]|nr:hypothetical protein GGI07_002617 [Coemansia sp. Benny D115]